MKLPFKPHLLVLLCSTGLFAASGVMFVKSRASEPVAPAPVAQQQVATPAAHPAPVVAPAYTAAQIDQWVARLRSIRTRCCLKFNGIDLSGQRYPGRAVVKR